MEEILHQLRLAVYPIIYRVSYMLGGAGTWTKGISFSNHWFSGDTRVSMEVIVTIVSKLVYNPFRGRIQKLVGGFNDFLFSPLPGKMIQFDQHIFQMGWNHQIEKKISDMGNDLENH